MSDSIPSYAHWLSLADVATRCAVPKNTVRSWVLLGVKPSRHSAERIRLRSLKSVDPGEWTPPLSSHSSKLSRSRRCLMTPAQLPFPWTTHRPAIQSRVRPRLHPVKPTKRQWSGFARRVSYAILTHSPPDAATWKMTSSPARTTAQPQ